MNNVEFVKVPRQLAVVLAESKAACDAAKATYQRQQRGEYLNEAEQTTCMLKGQSFMEKPLNEAYRALWRAIADMAKVLMRLALHDGQPKKRYYDAQDASDTTYRATPSMNTEFPADGVTEIPRELACHLAVAKADAIAADIEFKRLESNVKLTDDTAKSAIGWRLSGRNKLMAPAMAAHNEYLRIGNELAETLIGDGLSSR